MAGSVPDPSAPARDAGAIRSPGERDNVAPSPDLDAANLRQRLRALPPSARTVYDSLIAEGPLTHKDLLSATGMPARTVRYAVSRLKEAGVISARCNLMDCRQCYFFVVGACPGQGRSPFMKTGFRAM